MPQLKSSYKILLASLAIILAGCSDIVVNTAPGPYDGLTGTWEGHFGTFDAAGRIVDMGPSATRTDSIRISIGRSADAYEAHGVIRISARRSDYYAWSTRPFAFSSSILDVGGGRYSMRLFIVAESVVFEVWLDDGGNLIVHRPDAGWVYSLAPVTT